MHIITQLKYAICSWKTPVILGLTFSVLALLSLSKSFMLAIKKQLIFLSPRETLKPDDMITLNPSSASVVLT